MAAALIIMYRRLFREQQQQREQMMSGSMSCSQILKEQSLIKLLIPFESYLVSLQSILIWEKPYFSVIALALVNVLFWLVVSYSHRFYSFVAILFICISVYKTWVYQVWPEIRVPISEEEDTEEWTPVHPQVLSVPEISRYIAHVNAVARNYYEWLKQLRAEKPGTFCLFMSGTFSLLAVVGQVISGTVLAYIVVMAIMTVPGLILHVLPHAPFYNWWESLKEMIVSSFPPDQQPSVVEQASRNETDDLEEFLPESNGPEAEAALNTPFDTTESSLDMNATLMAKELGLESLLADDDENELLPGSSNMEMPVHEDDSGDENDVEFDLQEPVPTVNGSESSSNNNEMQFVPTHFNDSDTDNEEEAFAQGLHFSDVREDTPDRTSATSTLVSALSNLPLSTVSQTIVGSVSSIFSAVPRLPAHMTTSERSTSVTSDADLTDFEIVSESDIHSGD